MKQQDLIDRYVYAVVKHLPKKQAEDLDKELHGLIEDMLAERCQDRAATEKDVVIVLTELGTPQELAAQYSPDKENCLIGQPYYAQYKLILKWVLLAQSGGLLAAWFLELFMDTLQNGWETWPALWTAVGWIGTWLGVTLGVVGLLTVVFAILQRRSVNVQGNPARSLADLPPVPEKKEKISRADGIVDIVFSILFVVVFLGMPQNFCGVFNDGGTTEFIPFFQVEVLYTHWYFIAGLALCTLIDGIFQLLERRYTMRLAIVKCTTGIAGIFLVWGMISREGLINPVFGERLQKVTGEILLTRLGMEGIVYLFAVLITVITLVDMGVSLYRAYQYGKKL